jgi:Ca2+-binding RTX toxin-like protein
MSSSNIGTVSLESEVTSSYEPVTEVSLLEPEVPTAELQINYINPVDKASNLNTDYVSSGFQYRNDPITGEENQPHTGIDYVVEVGTDISAAAAGTVIRAEERPGYGNVVVVKHANGESSLYAHLSEFKVAVGDNVQAGQSIALSGGEPGAAGSGSSTGAHLHFSLLNQAGTSSIETSGIGNGFGFWSSETEYFLNPLDTASEPSISLPEDLSSLQFGQYGSYDQLPEPEVPGANMEIDYSGMDIPDDSGDSVFTDGEIFSTLQNAKDFLYDSLKNTLNDLPQTNQLTDSLFNIIGKLPLAAVSLTIDGVKLKVNLDEERENPAYGGNADQTNCDEITIAVDTIVSEGLSMGTALILTPVSGPAAIMGSIGVNIVYDNIASNSLKDIVRDVCLASDSKFSQGGEVIFKDAATGSELSVQKEGDSLTISSDSFTQEQKLELFGALKSDNDITNVKFVDSDGEATYNIVDGNDAGDLLSKSYNEETLQYDSSDIISHQDENGNIVSLVNSDATATMSDGSSVNLGSLVSMTVDAVTNYGDFIYSRTADIISELFDTSKAEGQIDSNFDALISNIFVGLSKGESLEDIANQITQQTYEKIIDKVVIDSATSFLDSVEGQAVKGGIMALGATIMLASEKSDVKDYVEALAQRQLTSFIYQNTQTEISKIVGTQGAGSFVAGGVAAAAVNLVNNLFDDGKLTGEEILQSAAVGVITTITTVIAQVLIPIPILGSAIGSMIGGLLSGLLFGGVTPPPPLSVSQEKDDGTGNMVFIKYAEGYSEAARDGYDDDLIGGEGEDLLVGADGDNQLVGAEGDDILHGMAGDDQLVGGEGDDILDGGEGDDQLIGGEGNDQLEGGAGDDVLLGGVGNDELKGGTGEDVLLGGEGQDYLEGGDGNDYLEGGADGDELIGGAGDDTLVGGKTETYEETKTRLHEKKLSEIRSEFNADKREILTEIWDVLIRVVSEQEQKDLRLEYLADGQNDFSGLITAIKEKIADFTDKNGEYFTVRSYSGTGSYDYKRYKYYDSKSLEQKIAIINDLDAEMELAVKNITVSEQEIADGKWVDGDDHLDGGEGNDVLIGENGNDQLIGGLGDDQLDGGEGNDYLDGGEGNDQLIGGAGDDHLDGGEGNDILFAGAGNDEIIGGLGNDQIDAGAGNDNIDGGEGNDILFAGAGNDEIIGGLGNDQLDGGEGDDHLDGGEGNDQLIAGAGNDIIDGGSGSDIIYGDAGNDQILAGEDNDLVYGGIGNDIISGEEGDDHLYGEIGDDIISGDAGDDIIGGGAGNDQLDGGEGNDRLDGGDGNDQLIAGTGNDQLDGGAGNDQLDGGEGNDEILGGAGDDVLIAGDGDDYLDGGAGNDIISGDAGDDIIGGGAGNDQLDGGDGNDRLDGGDGNDQLIAGTGNDQLDGGAGNDQLDGGEGNDEILGGAGDDVLIAGDGDDQLDGGAGNDQLDGGAGNDKILGGAGDDVLIAGAGDDYLDGGAGNDQLIAGSGNDNLLGGAGSDTYVITDNSGQNIIEEVGENEDIIEYSNARIEEVKLVKQGLDLLISAKNSNDNLLIRNQFSASNTAKIEKVKFADNFVIDLNRVIFGSDEDDEITGTEYQDVIMSGAGDDIVFGAEGDDYIDGGEGNDVIYGGSGNDYINGSERDDYLDGGEGNDVIEDGIGNDRMFGDSGDDQFIITQNSNDNDRITDFEIANKNEKINLKSFGDKFINLKQLNYFYGGLNQEGENAVINLGNNQILTLDNINSEDLDDKNFIFANFDELGSTKIVGDDGDNSLLGTSADDLINAGAGNDKIMGDLGNDLIDGGEGDDYLDGGAGNDQLIGGSGNDILVSGEGNDVLTGGEGYDEFQISKTTIGEYDIDMVTDFVSGEDTLNLKSYEDIVHIKQLNLEQRNQDIIINMTDKQKVIIENSQKSNLSNSDFKFNLFSGIGEHQRYGGNVNYDFSKDSHSDPQANGVYDISEDDSWSQGSQYRGSSASSYNGNSYSAASSYNGNSYYHNVSNIDNQGASKTLYNKVYYTGKYNKENKDVDFRGGNSSSGKFKYNGNDLMYGANWSERIYGYSGNDKIYGNNGHDYIDAGYGNDYVDGGNDNDRIYGGNGYDLLYGGNGNDYIDGGNDNDKIYGGNGYDLLYGGNGNDHIDGGNHNDSIYGGSGNDYLYGGSGNDYINGGSGNDYIDGGSGNDTIYGGSGNDVIYGGSGNDYINGDSGNDYIDGGSGNDRIYGSIGNDKIYGGSGHDYIVAGDGNDYVDGGNHNDSIYGGSGNDYLYGGSGNDYIYGDSSNDYIDGGTGNDIIYGGSGDDYINGSSGDDDIDGGSGNDIIYGGSGDDYINGSSGDDYIEGDSGNDSIYGGSGHDILHGEEGSDYLDGGSGNDKVYGGSGNDTIYGKDGNDYIEGGSGDDLIYSDRVTGKYGYDAAASDMVFGGDGNDTIYAGGNRDIIYGGNHDDSIYGEDGDDRLYGENGKDVIYGGSGDDYINGGNDSNKLYGQDGNDYILSGSGNDYIEGGAGNDIIDSGSGNNWLHGGSGNDVITAGDGNDIIYGGSGSDEINGGSGSDIINAGLGDDYVLGGAGNDEITGDIGDDLLYGGLGDDHLIAGDGNDEIYGDDNNDLLEGGDGDDQIYGGNHNDQLKGGIGDDYLDGGNNNDILEGGAGADILLGGVGSDILNGGLGADIFLYENIADSTSASFDIIEDFVQGEDKISLFDITDTDISFIDLEFTNDYAGNTIINYADFKLLVEGELVFNSDDFI